MTLPSKINPLQNSSLFGMRKTNKLMALGMGCLMAIAATSFGEAKSLSANIKLSFSGIPVGKLKTTVVLSGNKYTVSGVAKSKGIASIIAKTTGNTSSSGIIDGRTLIPTVHNLNYVTGKKAGNASIGFSDEKVSEVKATPAIKYKPGSVEVTKDHLANVLDPLSALVFPVLSSQSENGSGICNRTVPVFDGKNRFDLKFTYQKKSKQRTKGFSGSVYTCSVRYQPIAGHRAASKGAAFMVANKKIEVSFARISGSNVYAMYAFKVPTRRGTVVGQASKFKVR